MLTDLDKLYIALAEVNAGHLFNTFCYSLNIKSLDALRNYKSKGNILVNPDQIDIVKEKLANKTFDFKVLTDRVSNMIFTQSYCYKSRCQNTVKVKNPILLMHAAHKDVLVEAK